MDNSCGQNKNNFVLWLAPLLVKAGYFKKVNFIFYIVGHTKKACDCWFNTLKRMYRVSNISTFGQLLAKLNTHELININTIRDGDFKNFKLFEDKYYKVITSGKLLTGHIFTVEGSNPTTMIIQEDLFGTTVPHTPC